MVYHPASCRRPSAGNIKWHQSQLGGARTATDATSHSPLGVAAAAPAAPAPATTTTTPAPVTSRTSSPSASCQLPPTAPVRLSPQLSPVAPSPARAIAQTLRRDCAIAARAFVVAGLDDHGDVFVLPSVHFDSIRTHLARAPQWQHLLNYVGAPSPRPGRAGPLLCASDEPASSEWADVDSQLTIDSDDSRRASLSQPNQQPPDREISTVGISKSPVAEPTRAPKRHRSASSRNQSFADDDDDFVVGDELEAWSDAAAAAAAAAAAVAQAADAEPQQQQQQLERFPIENRAQVVTVLGRRLDQMQQLACKVILKAWIRAIEPKKQSNYPYVGSDKKKKQDADSNSQKKRSRPRDGPDAPPWWPTTNQNWWRLMPHPECATMEHVRHKEPDHLRKPERLVLGTHILLHQAQKEGGISLLMQSTKDCVLQFDQDNLNGDDRKGKRDLFLTDIYSLAQHWSDYVTDGIDGDTMISMKCYPKHALQTSKASASLSRKRQRQDSSVDTQESPRARAQEDLVPSTRVAELEPHASWHYSQPPSGLPAPSAQQISNFFPPPSNNDLRAYVPPAGKPFSDAVELQPAYQSAPMMPPQMFDDRYTFDAKPPPHFADTSAYPMSRDPSYVSQQPNYPDWRAVQSNHSPFSPTSTASLAQSSNASYAPSAATHFSGSVAYAYSDNAQLSPQQHHYSPMSAASPAVAHAMTVSGPVSMMPGVRTQSATFDEPPYINTFRTGSLSHPNMQYGMNNAPYPG